MPAVDAVIVAAIVAAFVIFAGVLAWAEQQTRDLPIALMRSRGIWRLRRCLVLLFLPWHLQRPMQIDDWRHALQLVCGHAIAARMLAPIVGTAALVVLHRYAPTV